MHVEQEDGNMRIKSIWAGLAVEKPGGENKPGVGSWYGGWWEKRAGESKSEVKPALNSAAVVKRRGQAMENVKQDE